MTDHPHHANDCTILEELRDVLGETLGLALVRRAGMTGDSALLGALPELDSMALAQLLGAIEDRFGIAFADEDLSLDHFATLGALASFVRARAG